MARSPHTGVLLIALLIALLSLCLCTTRVEAGYPIVKDQLRFGYEICNRSPPKDSPLRQCGNHISFDYSIEPTALPSYDELALSGFTYYIWDKDTGDLLFQNTSSISFPKSIVLTTISAFWDKDLTNRTLLVTGIVDLVNVPSPYSFTSTFITYNDNINATFTPQSDVPQLEQSRDVVVVDNDNSTTPQQGQPPTLDDWGGFFEDAVVITTYTPRPSSGLTAPNTTGPSSQLGDPDTFPYKGTFTTYIDTLYPLSIPKSSQSSKNVYGNFVPYAQSQPINTRSTQLTFYAQINNLSTALLQTLPTIMRLYFRIYGSARFSWDSTATGDMICKVNGHNVDMLQLSVEGILVELNTVVMRSVKNRRYLHFDCRGLNNRVHLGEGLDNDVEDDGVVAIHPQGLQQNEIVVIDDEVLTGGRQPPHQQQSPQDGLLGAGPSDPQDMLEDVVMKALLLKYFNRNSPLSRTVPISASYVLSPIDPQGLKYSDYVDKVEIDPILPSFANYDKNWFEKLKIYEKVLFCIGFCILLALVGWFIFMFVVQCFGRCCLMKTCITLDGRYSRRCGCWVSLVCCGSGRRKAVSHNTGGVIDQNDSLLIFSEQDVYNSW